jgi:hypothetical protein
MPIQSKIYAIGWKTPEEAVRRTKAGASVSKRLRPKIKEPEIPSIPGRTARLKAINLLQVAAEVEHALMVQYLYAAYSLDEAFDYGSGETTRVVDRWQHDIRVVARQEMAHFVTVQNLLISLGAEAYVNRENNFSEHPDEYPFPVRFERFGLDPLARYVVTESPSSQQMLSKKDKEVFRRALYRAARSKMQVRAKVNRVGTLYAALYWLFMKNDSPHGPWKMPRSIANRMHASDLSGVHLKDLDFVSPAEYDQFCAKPDEWEVFEDGFRVDDADPRSNALRAIRWIMIQGEGPSGVPCRTEDSHFCKFLRIYEDLEAEPRLAHAARDVPVNPVVLNRAQQEPVAAGAQSITHPQSKLWASLFNVRYQMLLLDVLLALSNSRYGSQSKLRGTLTNWAAGHEMEFLKRIGQLLPTLPRTHRGVGRAGAPFEVVTFPPENTKRWDQQRVLMEGSGRLVRQLKKMIHPHDLRLSLLQAIAEFDRDRKQCVESQVSLLRQKYEWRDGANQRIEHK